VFAVYRFEDWVDLREEVTRNLSFLATTLDFGKDLLSTLATNMISILMKRSRVGEGGSGGRFCLFGGESEEESELGRSVDELIAAVVIFKLATTITFYSRQRKYSLSSKVAKCMVLMLRRPEGSSW